MKTKRVSGFIVRAVLAAAAALVLLLAACDDSGSDSVDSGSGVTDLTGTWLGTNQSKGFDLKYVFTSTTWVLSYKAQGDSTFEDYKKGTYTVSNSRVTFNQTHSFNSGMWFQDTDTFTATLTSSTRFTSNDISYTKQQ
jgi:hypothetical protein